MSFSIQFDEGEFEHQSETTQASQTSSQSASTDTSSFYFDDEDEEYVCLDGSRMKKWHFRLIQSLAQSYLENAFHQFDHDMSFTNPALRVSQNVFIEALTTIETFADHQYIVSSSTSMQDTFSSDLSTLESTIVVPDQVMNALQHNPMFTEDEFDENYNFEDDHMSEYVVDDDSQDFETVSSVESSASLEDDNENESEMEQEESPVQANMNRLNRTPTPQPFRAESEIRRLRSTVRATHREVQTVSLSDLTTPTSSTNTDTAVGRQWSSSSADASPSPPPTPASSSDLVDEIPSPARLRPATCKTSPRRMLIPKRVKGHFWYCQHGCEIGKGHKRVDGRFKHVDSYEAHIRKHHPGVDSMVTELPEPRRPTVPKTRR